MHRTDGFTLVETLVAAALSALVLVSFLGMLRVAQVGDREHRCTTDAAQNLRLAALAIQQDVRLATNVSPLASRLILTPSGGGSIQLQFSDGQLTRLASGDGQPRILATDLDTTGSYFGMDAGAVTVHLQSAAANLAACPGSTLGADRSLDLSIVPYNR